MKKVFALLIVLLLISCDSWDGEVNGRRYKLVQDCLSSHDETQLLYINNQVTVITHTVCDEYGPIDTVWESKK